MIDRIGPYQLERELGRGGMGVVYLAHDDRLDRDVAIKALPEELAADAGRLERFEREARTLASLNHQKVRAICGVERHNDRKFLALEHVEGETLADRLERGLLAADEAVEVAVEISRGLADGLDARIKLPHRHPSRRTSDTTSGQPLKDADPEPHESRIQPRQGFVPSPEAIRPSSPRPRERTSLN